MATRKNVTTKLVLKLVHGVDSEGLPIVKSRSFSHMNPELTDADILNLGTKLASLQDKEISEIGRQDAAAIEAE